MRRYDRPFQRRLQRRSIGSCVGNFFITGTLIVASVVVCAQVMEATALNPPDDSPAQSAIVSDGTAIITTRAAASTLPAADANATDADDWPLVLVNPWHSIPDDFSVKLRVWANDLFVDERIYDALQAMLHAARRQGLDPVVCSAFRTSAKQASLFQNRTQRFVDEGYSPDEAVIQAARWVAVPGTSEHQLGLAVDIVARDYQLLDEQQENTPEQKWLMRHAHEYGFILRYPTDKCDQTGIAYEPWHYRYVGKAAATVIYENGYCLEEYLDRVAAMR